IRVEDKKARVDDRKCVACNHCADICPEEAVRLVDRTEPLLLKVNPAEVDRNELVKLCIKAHLHPRQLICLCAGTRVEEAAAAVLKGARSLQDITTMTGVCSGCTLYCTEPMLRLLKAAGIEPDLGEGRRLYNITPTIWDVPEEVIRKHPGYYLEEDKGVFRKT
ncbi:MAG: 4Fe-4S binding protein, partial [Deltaproteobacteria bacterium]|nr:4Fe-4S binding protein [Deltaproteobacteria bacterium]